MPCSSSSPLTPATGSWRARPQGRRLLDDRPERQGLRLRQATHLGDPSASRAPGASFVDLEPAPTGDGYWIADNQGHVCAYHAAGFSNVTDLGAGEEVTSISATRSGKGLWVFTNRGRVIVRGDATHYGDMAGVTLNGPVLDSIVAPDGAGYYMDFAADFRGSMGSTKLNRPMAGMVPYGTGYLMVAEDGGIFDFSPDKDFLGSLGNNPPAVPVISVAVH